MFCMWIECCPYTDFPVIQAVMTSVVMKYNMYILYAMLSLWPKLGHEWLFCAF